jgi:hypothetical protein
MGFMSIAKPSVLFYVGSGALLDVRVELRPARASSFGPSRRPPAGFRWLRGRPQPTQKCRNHPVYPYRRQPSHFVTPLPRQPHLRYAGSRQPKLRESGHYQPRPSIGLLRVTKPGAAPSERLLEEAEGVFQVEAPGVCPPEQTKVRIRPLRAGPPQPQYPRFTTPLASGQGFLTT